MTDDPRCGDGAFWHKDDADAGICRRRAPFPADTANLVTRWLLTKLEDSCGVWTRFCQVSRHGRPGWRGGTALGRVQPVEG